VTQATLLRAVRGGGGALARKDWLFDLAWRASASPRETTRTEAGNWVLLADDSGVAAQLAARLESKGACVTLIRHGARTEQVSDGWRVAVTDASGFARIISDAANRASRPPTGVVSLWALDTPAGIDTIEEVEDAQRRLVEGVLGVVRALGASRPRLWIVTRGAQPVGGCVPSLVQAPLLGLGNVIAAEAPDLGCVRLDLDPMIRADEPDLLFHTIWHGDAEDRAALRGGVRYVARMVPGTLAPPAEEPRVLEITARGQLDNLQYRRASRNPPGRGEVELRVHATGLNFRDVLNALGAYPGDPGPLGNECAGTVTAVGEDVEQFGVGDEVVSMVDRSFATYAIAPAALTVRKPAEISFVEAATVPVAFLTAAYALQTLGHIRKGDRVLIHAVTGGVGMAAVQIARLAGAEIIGTAGSSAKRELARALGVHHVADSRSLSFEAEVQRVTGGQGVDIVLNSLSDDFIPASLRVLRSGGRFIEIGKKGIWSATEVARQFPGIEYHALYLGEIAAAQPDLVRGMLEDILSKIASKELQALPRRVFPIERAQEAFRFMAQGHHTGKLVITQRQPVAVSDRATYLISGGLGGLGLACAQWLAGLGARHLVLLSRRAPNEVARAKIAELETQGVEVFVAPVDVADGESVRTLLADAARRMPPLRGILHAAGSVDDGLLTEQSWSRFERVMAPKVRGALNLHEMTRSAPLDFFVMFSSGAAVLGSPGQSNYAAANSFLDSLAYVRLANGRPALSVN
jgi:NADPH:quinone reductase-like Zn-dependent oxidoreductase